MLKQQVYNEWLCVRRKLASLGANIDLDSEDFRDHLDLAFANYALNEQPLYLSNEDKEVARELYGGLDGLKGGLAYRGYRIETEKELKEMQKLVNGGTWIANLDSFSHNISTAREFADFVKTYDPTIGMMQMQRAVEQGSAGKYGTYIMTVKPDKDNVIYNTSNNNITRRVEDELILDGPLKVISVEIRKPLTKDNWKKLTIDNWNSLEDLIASGRFFSVWLEKNGINPWDYGFGEWLSNNIRGKDKLAEFLKNKKFSGHKLMRVNDYYVWLNNHPNVRELFDNIVLKNDDLETFLDGEAISLGPQLYNELLALKGAEQAFSIVEEKGKVLTEEYKGYVVSDNKVEAGSYTFGSFLGVNAYISALIKAKKTGVFDKSMIKKLNPFSKFLKDLEEQPLTPKNIEGFSKTIADLISSGVSSNAADSVGFPLRKLYKNLVLAMFAKINDRNVNKVFKDNMERFFEYSAEILKNCSKLLSL